MSEAYSIGVDIGGTNVRIAAYGVGVSFFETIVLPTRLSPGRDGVVKDLCEAVSAFMTRDYGDRKLRGIGMGTPGPLELPAGILRNPPNLHGWDGFNLKTAITITLGHEIALANDANLAAFAEQRLGVGRKYGVADLCMITLGTGVGKGLVLNGRIWDGANGMAGEAGHLVVRADETLACGCGGRGCLEQYASATAVIRMARERLGDASPSTAHEVAMLARAGNEQARSIFDTAGQALAIAMSGLINTLNLAMYVLGGGVCDAWDLLSPTMFRELECRSYIYRLTKPEALEPTSLEARKAYIMKAELGPTAGLLGACVLGLNTHAVAATIGESLVYQ